MFNDPLYIFFHVLPLERISRKLPVPFYWLLFAFDRNIPFHLFRFFSMRISDLFTRRVDVNTFYHEVDFASNNTLRVVRLGRRCKDKQNSSFSSVSTFGLDYSVLLTIGIFA